MADNVETNSGSGGAVIATDNISGNHYQRVKIAHGPNDTADPASNATPFPIYTPELLLARGAITDHISRIIEGRNPAVGASLEGIWQQGGPFIFPTTSETVRVKVGGNAADAAAGAGAQSVTVQGIDENLDFVTEDITLNVDGTLASAATTAKYFRVNDCFVKDVGTYGGANTGNIVIENTTSTQILANLGAGISESRMLKWSVRNGYSLFIAGFYALVEGTKPATIRLWSRENNNDVSTPFSPKRLIFEQPELIGNTDHEFVYPEKINQNSDIWAEASTASGSSIVNIIVEFIEIKN